MFSEELKIIAREGYKEALDADSKKDGLAMIDSLIRKMWAKSIGHINTRFESIGGNISDNQIISTYRQMNNIWKNVYDELEKEKIYFFSRNSFGILCKVQVPAISKYLN